MITENLNSENPGGIMQKDTHSMKKSDTDLLKVLAPFILAVGFCIYMILGLKGITPLPSFLFFVK